MVKNNDAPTIDDEKRFYKEIKWKPTNQLGNCPTCNTLNNKIVFGWHPSYQMICENGHRWDTDKL